MNGEGWSFGDEVTGGMLSVDYIMHHHFSRHDGRRGLVFVWTCRPKYFPLFRDFFVLANGRLWSVFTSHYLLDGYWECMYACRDDLFRGVSSCSAWHVEYAECERRILDRN